ncbi:rho GTPase-activating protein 32-like isoform X3 [Apostichopus japonicus]|uniref:rho GTPase-activating protein 32-like isoform X3 n=1 Tax=Stichopus japonicus TaxID=307972 RepID=UPI003AB89726
MATTTLSLSPLPASPVKTTTDRGRKHRKRSEVEVDQQRSSLIDVEVGNSQFYAKVPLSPIEPEDKNNDVGIKRQATMRVKKMSSVQDTSTRFPKLNDCAHFHYDNVELSEVMLSMHDDPDFEEALSNKNSLPECLIAIFTVRVSSKERVWLIKRSYEDFRVLDKQLHSCIYDRRYSQLVELPKGIPLAGNKEAVRAMLSHYLSRFSQIAGNMINCGPVLNWMEIDKHGYQMKMENHGNHVIANDESAINIPAVAAAHVTKRYIAQAPDEISLEVGDMISVIDMPPSEETSWWRGKNGFDVGFFPSQCIELIGEHLPPSVAERVPRTPKPVLRKQGKLILFLRSFIVARPTKRGLKERGILRERVFGCDLGEHLMNSASEIPLVIKACTEFLEEHGVVDGIYRQSGVASNVQKLRDDFDCDIMPDLALYQKDVHCVSAVCKLYFRELPNPLLTYQLYKHFEEAAMSQDEVQLYQMHDTVQQLPPPHYRTLEYLIRHLAKMSTNHHITGMNIKNLAIVWAPNLLRSKDIEVGSCAAFLEIKVQATVVEYLIRNVDIIFNDKLLPEGADRDLLLAQLRPKSLVLSSPAFKLLSLEEARARSATVVEADEKPKYIEVGGGPSALPKQYHTVIDLPYDSSFCRKRLTTKSKKSPVWRAFFSRKEGKRKGNELAIKKGKRGSLRSVRSEESLSSTESGLNAKKRDEDLTDKAVVYRRSRSSSVAGTDNFRRSSSHDSFFELDPQVVAAATRDFIESTASAQKAKHQEDRENRKSDDRSSPKWIDQSISSADSEILSPPGGQFQDSVYATPIPEGVEEPVSGGVKLRRRDQERDSGHSSANIPCQVRRDVHVQTPTEDEFPMNLDGAVLGSASPRKSTLFRMKELASPVISPRCSSLDAVMSEYDTLLERYGNNALTPEFLTSSDSLATNVMTTSRVTDMAPIASADSTSSPSEFTPVPPPRRGRSHLPESPTSPPWTIIGPIFEAESCSGDLEDPDPLLEEEASDYPPDDDAIDQEVVTDWTTFDDRAVTNGDHGSSVSDNKEDGYVVGMNNLSVEFETPEKTNIPQEGNEDLLEEEEGMMMSEEEGAGHALPGETVIISDIIEL